MKLVFDHEIELFLSTDTELSGSDWYDNRCYGGNIVFFFKGPGAPSLRTTIE